jgi:hypothetical protein
MNLTPEMRRAMERKPVHREATQIYANTNTQNNGQITKLERPTCNEPLATRKGKKEASGRVHFKFVSVRKRLIDPDNVSVKWLLDCCRRIGLVAGDEHDKITLETAQRKAAKGEEEHTRIEIIYP